FTLLYIFSWTISLRVLVQRCPAVPTAPNTAAAIVMFKSAFGVIIIALFPPNSNSVLPNLRATFTATSLPIFVEPVADTKFILGSSLIHFPAFASLSNTEEIPSGRSFFFKISASIFWHATAHKGAFSLGFQIITFPHTKAMAAFHDHTATGKLKAEIIPTIPRGWY